jgi:hypothetical protein
LTGGGFALGFEISDGGSRGEAIERHVHKEGVASGGGGARGGAKAFPFGAAGFVDVDVRIDKSREEGGVSEIGGGNF